MALTVYMLKTAVWYTDVKKSFLFRIILTNYTYFTLLDLYKRNRGICLRPRLCHWRGLLLPMHRGQRVAVGWPLGEPQIGLFSKTRDLRRLNQGPGES